MSATTENSTVLYGKSTDIDYLLMDVLVFVFVFRFVFSLSGFFFFLSSRFVIVFIVFPRFLLPTVQFAGPRALYSIFIHTINLFWNSRAERPCPMAAVSFGLSTRCVIYATANLLANPRYYPSVYLPVQFPGVHS